MDCGIRLVRCQARSCVSERRVFCPLSAWLHEAQTGEVVRGCTKVPNRGSVGHSPRGLCIPSGLTVPRLPFRGSAQASIRKDLLFWFGKKLADFALLDIEGWGDFTCDQVVQDSEPALSHYRADAGNYSLRAMGKDRPLINLCVEIKVNLARLGIDKCR